MSGYKYGGMVFQTKTKLRNYVKYVLNNARKNQPLEGDWFNVLNDILKEHPSYSKKVGEGSYSISTRTCPMNPRNSQFYILREDGTDTDFSAYKVIDRPSKVSEVKQALRALVVEQTRHYKERYFAENSDSRGFCICPATGLKINLRSSHLDHYPTQFDEIVHNWCVLNGINMELIEILEGEDNTFVPELANKELAASFYDYHLINAKYRVVLDKVNQQRERWKKS